MKAVLFDMGWHPDRYREISDSIQTKGNAGGGIPVGSGNGIQIPQLCIRICKRADEGNFWRGFPIR